MWQLPSKQRSSAVAGGPGAALPDADLAHPPFGGFPPTEPFLTDSGQIGYRVTVPHVTPRGAKLVAGLTDLSVYAPGAALLLCAMPALATAAPLRGLLLSGLALGGIVLAASARRIHRAWRRRLESRVVITVAPDRIGVERAGGVEVFDRKVKHRFISQPHPLAEIEAEQSQLDVERARKRGVIIPHATVYKHSRVIALIYYGQRRPLIEIHGRETAASVVERLQALTDLVETQVRTGRPITNTPQDAWADDVGALPAKAAKPKRANGADRPPSKPLPTSQS